MIIKQLLIGPWDVFCYILGCELTGAGLVIDPAGDVGRILKEIDRAGLTLKYIVNTHRHSDHTAGNALLQQKTGAALVIHRLDSEEYPKAEILIDSQKTLQLGTILFEILHTPGHTPGGICLYGEEQLFTGDTLFVGDSGRTDLPGGNRSTLGASLRRLMKLPDSTVVWPGHDYGQTPHSTLGWEKRHNVNAKEYGFLVP